MKGIARVKFCPRCKQTLPVSEFHTSATRGDGLAGHCKICRRLYEQSPERRAAHAAWYRSEAGQAYQRSEARKAAKKRFDSTPAARKRANALKRKRRRLARLQHAPAAQ